MLRRVLDLMAGGVPLTTQSLARALDVTPAEVDAMLRDLAARGFLRDVACGQTGACGKCAGCPSARSCTEGESSRAWSLTEKGRRAASATRAAAAPAVAALSSERLS